MGKTPFIIKGNCYLLIKNTIYEKSIGFYFDSMY